MMFETHPSTAYQNAMERARAERARMLRNGFGRIARIFGSRA